MNFIETLKNIIETKFRELNQNENQNCPFWQIQHFEGNAVGQIGEKFVKQIFESYRIPFDRTAEVVHNEYDMISNGKKIEIKTARKGKTNNTFQFNGINPNYNHHLIICIGITPDNVYYHIFKNSDITYNHSNRQHFIRVSDSKTIALVKMNPNNLVNLKATINIRDLTPLDESFVRQLREYLQ